jgi:hypothetical protein
MFAICVNVVLLIPSLHRKCIIDLFLRGYDFFFVRTTRELEYLFFCPHPPSPWKLNGPSLKHSFIYQNRNHIWYAYICICILLMLQLLSYVICHALCIYMFLNVCVVTVFMSAKSSTELTFVMLHCKPDLK